MEKGLLIVLVGVLAVLIAMAIFSPDRIDPGIEKCQDAGYMNVTTLNELAYCWKYETEAPHKQGDVVMRLLSHIE